MPFALTVMRDLAAPRPMTVAGTFRPTVMGEPATPLKMRGLAVTITLTGMKKYATPLKMRVFVVTFTLTFMWGQPHPKR